MVQNDPSSGSKDIYNVTKNELSIQKYDAALLFSVLIYLY